MKEYIGVIIGVLVWLILAFIGFIQDEGKGFAVLLIGVVFIIIGGFQKFKETYVQQEKSKKPMGWIIFFIIIVVLFLLWIIGVLFVNAGMLWGILSIPISLFLIYKFYKYLIDK